MTTTTTTAVGVAGSSAVVATTASLGDAVRSSSDALRLAGVGTLSLDEAQDAMYFHHDGLWKARAHYHDILGALCVLSTTAPPHDGEDGDDGGGGGGGRWPDFPADVALAVERYATSAERSYPAQELMARLALAVRGKLVLGEVGNFGVATTTITTTRTSLSSSGEIRRWGDDGAAGGRKEVGGLPAPAVFCIYFKIKIKSTLDIILVNLMSLLFLRQYYL
jgi:hypothetical protein